MTQPTLPFEPPKKKRPGFHLIKLSGSKKLQRLHNVLLAAKNQGRKMSSLELTVATNLVAISTWCSHLRGNGIVLENEVKKVNGESVWFWWIGD